jgi:hypothetical protein
VKLPFAVSFALFVPVAAALAAGEFDGSRPLSCAPSEINDCLPGDACKQTTPEEAGVSDALAIDFATREVRGRYREKPMPIGNLERTAEQLILQGTDLLFAWSMVTQLETGKFTATIADRKGAFVLFGACTAK